MEILSIFDNNGNLTNKTVVRGSKIKLDDNEHIGVAIIFIENDEGNFLIQKSSKENGGEFSTTGGHILSGETPIEAIVRECEEEIGISLSKDEIIDLGYILYDLPIRFIFYVHKNIDINDLKLQAEEVEYVAYMTKEEVNKIINSDRITKSHGILFNEVMRRLGK